jgi:hypothetical protein
LYWQVLKLKKDLITALTSIDLEHLEAMELADQILKLGVKHFKVMFT